MAYVVAYGDERINHGQIKTRANLNFVVSSTCLTEYVLSNVQLSTLAIGY